jgi:hypothetical protein
MKTDQSGVLLLIVIWSVTFTGCYSQLGTLEEEQGTHQTNQSKAYEKSTAISIDRQESLYHQTIDTYYGLLNTSVETYDPSSGPIYLFYSLQNQDRWLDWRIDAGIDDARQMASGSWIEPIDNSERLTRGPASATLNGSQTTIRTTSIDAQYAAPNGDLSNRSSVFRELPVTTERNSDRINRAHQSVVRNNVHVVERPALNERERREIQERNFMILSRIIEDQGGHISYGYPGYYSVDGNRVRSAGTGIYTGSDHTRNHTTVRSRSADRRAGKTINRTRSGSDRSSGTRSRSSSSNDKRSSGSVDKDSD